MSSIDLVFNNNLEPAPITSIDVQPTSAPAGNSVGSEEMEAPASALGDGASAAATDRPAQSTAANALSVLLAALPSGLRSSIVSEFVATHTTSTRTTLTPTPSTRSTTTSLSITLFTSTRASSTSSSTPAATTTAAPPADSQQTSHGSIAGVVTGVVAGAVLIILAIVLMIRRSRQGKAPFGPRGSQRSRGSGRAYPEVAWLYDPSPTPPHEPRVYPQEESGASLLPQASRTQEMTTAGRASSHLDRAGPESPVLPPHMPFARAGSPEASPGASPSSSRTSSPRSGGQRSGRSSVNSSDPRRPLHAIFEEAHAQ